MTLKKLIDEAIVSLEKMNIDDAEFDARTIMTSLLDIDTSELLFIYESELENIYDRNTISNILMEYDKLVSLRASHFPLQYIMGYTYFCGLRFDVNRNVLIPRQDTEILVEKVLSDNQDKNISICDMCTGSGCIAISLANLGNYKVVVGTDISYEALEIAAKNAENLTKNIDYDDELNQQVYFLQSDMFSDFKKLSKKIGIDKFDIITCNPPYIKTCDIDDLMDEVKSFEPNIALDGSDDGLRFYKIIASNAKMYLNENGKIYLEIGYDQFNQVLKIFEKSGYNFVSLEKDLGGNDRVVVFSV